jgi:hypothetical protein
VQRLPLELTIAKDQALNYRVQKTPRGYASWRFRDWPRRQGGWSILANYQTHEQALQDIEHRLDLEREQPKPMLIMATITYVDHFDDGLGPLI